MLSKRLYGLIGYPLSHSFSKKYFAEKFEREKIEDSSYELFEIDTIDKIRGLIEGHDDLQGLNVTIPYKQQVFNYLDKVDPKAQEIGAVNVIKIQQGELIGYNSDYFGFKESLLKWLDGTKLEQALILGTGGASKAVKCVLQDLEIAYRFVSRSKREEIISYAELHDDQELISNCQLIINTTPLGTHPNVLQKPDIPYNHLTSDHWLYDLVYNPSVTTFMQEGLDRGAKVINGYQMLVGQAEKAWEIWND